MRMLRDDEPAAKIAAPSTHLLPKFVSAPGFVSISGLNSSFPSAATTSNSAPTPDFLSFEGSYSKDLVRLNWSVSPNTNAVGFTVQRRTQADEKWSTITYMRADAKKNPNGYSYYDLSGVEGVTYYRVRQVVSNGKDVPTPAICVMPYLIPNSFVIWQHKVDPFTRFGTLSFGLGSSMPVNITMVDCYGRKAATLASEIEMEAGHHIIPFSTAALPSGVYTLQIETAVGSRSQRIAVL